VNAFERIFNGSTTVQIRRGFFSAPDQICVSCVT